MEPVLKVLFTDFIAQRCKKCRHWILLEQIWLGSQILGISVFRLWLRREERDGRSWIVVVTFGLRHAPLLLHQRAASPQTSTGVFAKARSLRRHSIARRQQGRALLTDWLCLQV